MRLPVGIETLGRSIGLEVLLTNGRHGNRSFGDMKLSLAELSEHRESSLRLLLIIPAAAFESVKDAVNLHRPSAFNRQFQLSMNDTKPSSPQVG